MSRPVRRHRGHRVGPQNPGRTSQDPGVGSEQGGLVYPQQSEQTSHKLGVSSSMANRQRALWARVSTSKISRQRARRQQHGVKKLQEITGGCCKARGRKGLNIYGVFSCSRRYKVASQLIVVSRLVVPSSRSHSSEAKNGTQNKKARCLVCT